LNSIRNLRSYSICDEVTNAIFNIEKISAIGIILQLSLDSREFSKDGFIFIKESGHLFRPELDLGRLKF
jgi:hypothetical protein